ncbi:hypothetical protein [Pseudoflavitalea rhizosphaerae]|uniref:hypothetical protein n=1 Tax=Pseudoflavitalea rhizosphaerae TaxID=1884793 RepID=UPI000F8E7399|nr:hypothetical protein [Pseudoflavitalea rhizosphaerae]
MRYIFLLFSCISFVRAQAQSDPWTGVWKMNLKRTGQSDLQFQIHIGKPEQGLLYPAVITIQDRVFTGVYEMLLVRKSEYQLGIGRSKYPIKETPFKLGIWLWYLNGTLDMKDNQISVNRLFIDQADFWMRGLYDDDEIFVVPKVMIRDFLYRNKITLTRSTNKAFPDSSAGRILHPEISKLYFGIYDRIESTQDNITIRLADNERYDKDTVTLLHNGRAIFTKEQITDANRVQNLRLDSGRNLFLFFAYNYGNIQPNTGNLQTTIDGKDYEFSFGNRFNAYATFIVADIYHHPSQEPARDTMVNKRITTPIASFTVNTADIILELRDTEIQDGDSISLRFNGKWIAKGFPVKKTIQEIPVKLHKGENRLLFVADNLGSIPPNTAELRIRYGNEVRSLALSTDLAKNNEIILMLE